MTSTFSGLSTALSALYAQRRGLDVTGQNIANANTEGYSRQRVDMRAIASQQVPAVHAVWSGAGAGVDVTAISRARDAFLEARGRAEHAQGAYLDVQKQVFGSVESIFTEPSDTALQSQFDDYWAAWHDVANNPGLLAARNQLLERGRVVTDGLSRAFDQLGAEFTISRSQLEAFATDINTTTKTIAELNQSINRAQAAGLPVNELADQRDLQLMHLAEVAGTTAIARPDGTMDVLLGGSTLVSGSSSRELKVGGGTRLEDLVTDPTGQRVSLQWADNGRTATATDGRVAAHLQSLNTILPDYANQLDAIAASSRRRSTSPTGRATTSTATRAPPSSRAPPRAPSRSPSTTRCWSPRRPRRAPPTSTPATPTPWPPWVRRPTAPTRPTAGSWPAWACSRRARPAAPRSRPPWRPRSTLRAARSRV
ncbi:flagellar hook-associated protein FlgK [Luedemannella flava]